MLNLPRAPLAVVTRITPDAPREPYWAVSEAFFRTLNERISDGNTVESVARSLETPSITTSGSLPPVSEVVPRTRTLVSMACRWSPPRDTFTPGRRPLIASRGLKTRPLSPKPPVLRWMCISAWSPIKLSGCMGDMFLGVPWLTCAQALSWQIKVERHAVSTHATSRTRDVALLLPCCKEQRRCLGYERIPSIFIRATV